MSSERRTNPSRFRRCTCSLGHSSREACEADPSSRRYTGYIELSSSSSSDTDTDLETEVTPEAEVEVEAKMPAASKRKGVTKGKEQPKAKKSKVMVKMEIEDWQCDCDAGHESLVDCENDARKKRMDVTMRSVQSPPMSSNQSRS
jgi:hypothetical protein